MNDDVQKHFLMLLIKVNMSIKNAPRKSVHITSLLKNTMSAMKATTT